MQEAYRELGICTEEKSALEEGQLIFAVVAKMRGAVCGLASGMYSGEDGRFRILALYLLPEQRTRELSLGILRELLERVRRRFSPRRYEWIYRLRDESRDPYGRMVEKLQLPWISGRKREPEGTLYKMETAALRVMQEGINHNGAYWKDEELARRGFSVCLLAQLGEEGKEQIRALVESEDAEGLSPLTGEEYDASSSLVMTDLASGTVCGWVACCRIAPRGLEIRRWYVANAYRRRRVGLWLGAYMLRVMQSDCDFVYFTVLPGNESMTKFAKGYLGKAVVEENPLCRLVWEDGGKPQV